MASITDSCYSFDFKILTHSLYYFVGIWNQTILKAFPRICFLVLLSYFFCMSCLNLPVDNLLVIFKDKFSNPNVYHYGSVNKIRISLLKCTTFDLHYIRFSSLRQEHSFVSPVDPNCKMYVTLTQQSESRQIYIFFIYRLGILCLQECLIQLKINHLY